MQHEPAEFVFLRASSRLPDATPMDDGKVPQLDEIRALLRTMRERVRISNKQLRRLRLRYNLIFKTIAFGGTRPGEALGLAWTNVDFQRGGIRIMQDVDDDGSIGLLKSRAAYRFINMPDHYMRQLKRWRLLCPKSKLDLVFPNWTGKVEFLSKLPACPVCCFATVRRHFSFTGGTGALISATITEFETAGATQEDDPVLHCVEQRVQALAGSFPYTLNTEELRALVREVQVTCPLDEGHHE